jgi:hypothetical protein
VDVGSVAGLFEVNATSIFRLDPEDRGSIMSKDGGSIFLRNVPYTRRAKKHEQKEHQVYEYSSLPLWRNCEIFGCNS